MRYIATLTPILIGLCAFACDAGSPTYESILENHEDSTYHALYLVNSYSTVKDERTTAWRETYKQGDRFREDWRDQVSASTTLDVVKNFNVACRWGGGELPDINSLEVTCERVDKPDAFSGLPTYRGGTLINYDAVEGYDEVGGRTILGESVRCFRSTTDNFKKEECFTKDAWLAFAQTETNGGVQTLEAHELSPEVPEAAFTLPTHQPLE